MVVEGDVEAVILRDLRGELEVIVVPAGFLLFGLRSESSKGLNAWKRPHSAPAKNHSVSLDDRPAQGHRQVVVVIEPIGLCPFRRILAAAVLVDPVGVPVVEAMADPWNSLVPDLVTTLKAVPSMPPYSAVAPVPSTWISATSSSFIDHERSPPSGAVRSRPSMFHWLDLTSAPRRNHARPLPDLVDTRGYRDHVVEMPLVGRSIICSNRIWRRRSDSRRR